MQAAALGLRASNLDDIVQIQRGYLVGDLCMAGGDVHVTAPLDAGKARFLAGV